MGPENHCFSSLKNSTGISDSHGVMKRAQHSDSADLARTLAYLRYQSTRLQMEVFTKVWGGSVKCFFYVRGYYDNMKTLKTASLTEGEI